MELSVGRAKVDKRLSESQQNVEDFETEKNQGKTRRKKLTPPIPRTFPQRDSPPSRSSLSLSLSLSVSVSNIDPSTATLANFNALGAQRFGLSLGARTAVPAIADCAA